MSCGNELAEICTCNGRSGGNGYENLDGSGLVEALVPEVATEGGYSELISGEKASGKHDLFPLGESLVTEGRTDKSSSPGFSGDIVNGKLEGS